MPESAIERVTYNWHQRTREEIRNRSDYFRCQFAIFMLIPTEMEYIGCFIDLFQMIHDNLVPFILCEWFLCHGENDDHWEGSLESSREVHTNSVVIFKATWFA